MHIQWKHPVAETVVENHASVRSNQTSNAVLGPSMVAASSRDTAWPRVAPAVAESAVELALAAVLAAEAAVAAGGADAVGEVRPYCPQDTSQA